MVSPLKYAHAGGKLTPKKVARLAAGLPDRYYQKLIKTATIGTIITTFLILTVMIVVIVFCLSIMLIDMAELTFDAIMGRIWLSVITMTGAFFALAAGLIAFIRVFSPSCLDYGQNKFDAKREDKLKRIRQIMYAPFFIALAGSIVCGIIFSVTAKTLASSVGVIVCWLLCYGVMSVSASLFFLLKKFQGTVCKNCEMTNTIFGDGSYRHDYGDLESRVVNASPTSYTAGTIYDSSGTKVGTVIGHDTTYTYAEGRSYKETYFHKCACCGNVTTNESSGFEETRRYKV